MHGLNAGRKHCPQGCSALNPEVKLRTQTGCTIPPPEHWTVSYFIIHPATIYPSVLGRRKGFLRGSYIPVAPKHGFSNKGDVNGDLITFPIPLDMLFQGQLGHVLLIIKNFLPLLHNHFNNLVHSILKIILVLAPLHCLRGWSRETDFTAWETDLWMVLLISSLNSLMTSFQPVGLEPVVSLNSHASFPSVIFSSLPVPKNIFIRRNH